MTQDPIATSGNQRDNYVARLPKVVDEPGFSWPAEGEHMYLMNCRLIIHRFVSDKHSWGTFYTDRIRGPSLYCFKRGYLCRGGLNRPTLQGKCFTPKDGKWKSLSETSEVKRWRATIFA